MSRRTFARAFASLSLCVAALSAAAAPSYSGLVVFGDSLSDSGNNAELMKRTWGFVPPPSFQNDYEYSTLPSSAGTYTNGKVWTQYLAESLGVTLTPSELGGTNYAYGGAQTATDGPGLPGMGGPGVANFPYSLRHQLDSYLGSPSTIVDPNALYIVAGGGNDVRAALESGADDTTALALAQQYAVDTAGLVWDLKAAGAEHILVLNVPNFGLTPMAHAFGVSAEATVLSAGMNFFLQTALAGSGASIFDTFSFMTATVGAGAASGFDNVTNACGAVVNGCDLDTALFWDAIHPTTLAHEKLAAAVYAVTAVPEPESAAMLALGLAVLALGARRRAAVQQR